MTNASIAFVAIAVLFLFFCLYTLSTLYFALVVLYNKIYYGGQFSDPAHGFSVHYVYVYIPTLY